jgi:hypothetical protein
LEARDHGRVLAHGGGPEHCDALGARDVWVFEWVFEAEGRYYLHYDGEATNPASAWTKRKDVVPLRPRLGTYYNATTFPGTIIRHGDYRMFFSAARQEDGPLKDKGYIH